MGLKIIDDKSIDIIRHRIARGESFTQVAKDYGVKAWTIQKRLKIYHPKGGRNTSDTWTIYPDYMSVVYLLYRKYKFIDVNIYDIILDWAYRFTKNELNKIESSDRKFWTMYNILRSKIYACEIKKRQRAAGVKCFITTANALVYNSRLQIYEML